MARYFSCLVVGLALLATSGDMRAIAADDAKATAGAAKLEANDTATADTAKTEESQAQPGEEQEKATAKSTAKRTNKERNSAAAAAPDLANAIELFGAVEDGKLEMKFVAKSDHNARVLLTNPTKKPMTVQLPAAFAGVPALAQRGGGMGGGGRNIGGGGGGGNNNNANQSVGGGFGGGGLGGGGFGGGGGGGFGGGGGGGGFFSIPPERTVNIDVAVVCLNHGLRDPSSSIAYKLVPVEQCVDRPAVVELLKAFGRGELQHGAAQAAAWHLNNDLSWSELAAKQQGTVRSLSRPPYFSNYEIQAGMAYANEASRRGQLVQLAQQTEKKATDSSEAISTAPDNSREPTKASATEETDKKANEKTRRASTQPVREKTAAGATSTQP